MNVIKNATRPASNKTPDERMAYFVVVIVQEGNNKQFRVCLMSQNRVVAENKTIFQTRTQSHVFLVNIGFEGNGGVKRTRVL